MKTTIRGMRAAVAMFRIEAMQLMYQAYARKPYRKEVVNLTVLYQDTCFYVLTMSIRSISIVKDNNIDDKE
jgi:hypothetical protein